MFLDIDEDNEGMVMLSDFIASIDDQEEFERAVVVVHNEEEDNTP